MLFMAPAVASIALLALFWVTVNFPNESPAAANNRNDNPNGS
jgi:hypothetical protein